LTRRSVSVTIVETVNPDKEAADMAFDGQRVVIVGASAGIGEATAGEFAAAGAEVIITGRSKERLDAAAERIGRPVQAAELDATDAGT
jgi:NADP-dependent 3-hydroxy acid dehydrogenase YdfG